MGQCEQPRPIPGYFLINKMSKIENTGTWHMLVHRKPAMFDLYITLVTVYVA